jgi:hypothetical protein
MRMSRSQMVFWSMTYAAVAVLPVAVFVALYANLRRPKALLTDLVIHAMGGQLAWEIEAWRVNHGHYPASLDEAGLKSPTTYQGGFRYQADSTGFVIELGFADSMNVKHVYMSAAYVGEQCAIGWRCFD